MTRPAFAREVVGPWLAIVAAVLAVIAAVLAVGHLADDSGDRVDRADYAAGWQYVAGRQPDAGWTDEGALAACRAYADRLAQLDGVRSVETFLRGCVDATAMTDLERRPA